MKKKLLLCILDGFALGKKDYKYNAVFNAKIPNLELILQKYPYSFLQTSGLAIGLPKNQMGNSEVGHMTIGSGRILMQDLPLISNAIETGDIWQKQPIQKTLINLKNSNGRLHILGLCSHGGVHSYLPHIHAVANFFNKNGIKVFVHAISDGRDVAPDDFKQNLQNFKNGFEKGVEIVTLCGRYYSMDRDKKYERTSLSLDLILDSKGTKFNTIEDAVSSSYSQDISDEFIKPSIVADYDGVKENDILFFANFRADRARQIMEMVIKSSRFKMVFTMMPCSQEISLHSAYLFAKEEIVNTLPEVISNAGLKQFRIAETEKYAHITFFFNGGKEQILKGEDRVIIPSPKVATYDLKPEMSLPEVEDKLIEVIKEKQYDFIACNIANGDMVGHTGNFEAAKKAMERIDEFLGKMEEVCLQNDYYLLITADHGNLEEMLDESGKIHTQHTTGDVPFFLISKENIKLKNGSLANIAPTILKLLNLNIPKEMEKHLIAD